MLNSIIRNALLVDKTDLSKNIKDIVEQIKKSIKDSEAIIKEANKIDEKNNNGFILDFNVIDKILSNIENIYYGDVTLSKRNDSIVYGKQIMDIGNVVVISDGNPYITIEMAIRNIMAGNTTIFANDGFMYGTNQLLIQLIESILIKHGISRFLIQIYCNDNYTDILKQFANIDLVVCIGNHNLQNFVLRKSKNKTITSGYENFDLYIEDNSHIDFINTIINTGLNIEVYSSIDYPNSIKVSGIEEAIAQINYSGNKYSAAIFTSDTNNASKFIREIKSKIVTVNTSPTIERIIDIKQMDLVNEKTIIYPFNFKIENKNSNE